MNSLLPAPLALSQGSSVSWGANPGFFLIFVTVNRRSFVRNRAELIRTHPPTLINILFHSAESKAEKWWFGHCVMNAWDVLDWWPSWELWILQFLPAQYRMTMGWNSRTLLFCALPTSLAESLTLLLRQIRRSTVVTFVPVPGNSRKAANSFIWYPRAITYRFWYRAVPQRWKLVKLPGVR